MLLTCCLCFYRDVSCVRNDGDRAHIIKDFGSKGAAVASNCLAPAGSDCGAADAGRLDC